ncbi:endonuclease 4-like [Magnolia sinica]|uniref:endonuclease 4-like n=1 Tax=Magnolia sinica TaxID=86752 RepID=UPI002657E1BA|nr:endonuclease 4-like [Magnolia sinica]
MHSTISSLNEDTSEVNKELKYCSASAAISYENPLYTRESLLYNLTESLMFLSHIVGDIHQPLHVGFRADFGGNTIRVHGYQKMTNLHKVWDDNIIQTAMSDFYGNDLNRMMESIQRNLTEEWMDEIHEWETCGPKSVACPDKYASESVRLACDYAYKNVTNNSTLGDEYFLSRLPIVQKRIAQAGVRLASVLNRIFDVSGGQRNPVVAIA